MHDILKTPYFQLKDSLKDISFLQTENYDARAEDTLINMIIIHYTEISEGQTIEHFANKESKVSTHFMINKKGKIFSFVDPLMRAWHAGDSYWLGHDKLNDNSIGIELVNNGKEKYTNEQYTSLVTLINNLKLNYKIENKYIVGHSDVAPLRKLDPGYLFDWKILHNHNIGLYYSNKAENNNIILKKGERNNLVLDLQKSLSLLGYKIKKDGDFGVFTAKVIYAFKSHFNPIYLSCEWDSSSQVILAELLKMR